MNRIKTEKIMYFDDCKICGFRIKADTEAQVNYRMSMHQAGKNCRKK